VLSKGDAKREMDRKVREYFLSGVRLVWLVDMVKRAVRVYTAPDESMALTEADVLDGGGVLPGLALPVRQVFAEVPAAKRAAGPRKRPRTPNGG
jgi:Uma2 family endonuclease